MPTTVRKLIEDLSQHDLDMPIDFGCFNGLTYYRCNDVDGRVHMEFSQSFRRDKSGSLAIVDTTSPERNE